MVEDTSWDSGDVEESCAPAHPSTVWRDDDRPLTTDSAVDPVMSSLSDMEDMVESVHLIDGDVEEEDEEEEEAIGRYSVSSDSVGGGCGGGTECAEKDDSFYFYQG